MTFDIHDLRQVRRKIGMTQIALAKESGVSQSLIAKIESGKLDPTYSKAKQIIQAVEFLSGKSEMTAKELMQKRIISVGPGATVKAVIRKLQQHNISQMPVIHQNKAVGLVSEATLLDVMMEEKHQLQIQDIMSEAPPTISLSTGSRVITELLKYFPLVLVTDKGRIRGLVTKSDIIQ
ncbi:MAG: CBS domain-containing protein, partial [DPANN group archaeon]|nr:CBS domain-containing protein [DPANN group archaeon]